MYFKNLFIKVDKSYLAEIFFEQIISNSMFIFKPK